MLKWNWTWREVIVHTTDHKESLARFSLLKVQKQRVNKGGRGGVKNPEVTTGLYSVASATSPYENSPGTNESTTPLKQWDLRDFTKVVEGPVHNRELIH